MAWARFSPAFWISPGVRSMPLISPSKLWARICRANTYWLISRASGWSQRVLQFCGGAAQGLVPRHPAIAYLIFAALWANSVLCRDSCAWLANRRHRRRLFRARSTADAGRSGSNRLRLHRLTGFPVAKESSDRRTLDAGIASCHLRLISPHRHSRLREHRSALDVVWIFLGGANRNRLPPGRNCHLLRNYGCPGRQTSCVDAVAVRGSCRSASYFYPTAQSGNMGRRRIQSGCDRGMLDIRRVSREPRRSRTNQLCGKWRHVTARSGGCLIEQRVVVDEH